MIFTGQAWNMTFSFYHSLRSVPQRSAGSGHGLPLQLVAALQLGGAAVRHDRALVWNSMMSMAGGWFFLMINEAFQLGDKDFRLPGLGSYMSVAVDAGRRRAPCSSAIAGDGAHDRRARSTPVAAGRRLGAEVSRGRGRPHAERATAGSWHSCGARGCVAASTAWSHRGSAVDVARRAQGARRAERRGDPRRDLRPALAGARPVSCCSLLAPRLGAARPGCCSSRWLQLPGQSWAAHRRPRGGVTLGRVLVSTALGTLWALPAGLAIGLSPRLSRVLQPIVQVAASFPGADALPAGHRGSCTLAGSALNCGSVLLMLLGTQWYILFNVIAGAMAVPADLREAARSFRLGLWQRLWTLYIPGRVPLPRHRAGSPRPAAPGTPASWPSTSRSQRDDPDRRAAWARRSTRPRQSRTSRSSPRRPAHDRPPSS